METVTLHPYSTLCSVTYRKKRPTDKPILNWYENGHDKKLIHVHDKTDEEIETLKSDILKNRCTKTTDTFTIPVNEIRDVHMRHYRYVQPVEHFESMDVPIDPYYIGIWLGDGTSLNTDITTIELDIYNFLCNYADKMGLYVSKKEDRPRKTKAKSDELETVSRLNVIGKDKNGDTLLSKMKKLGLNGKDCKHIPEIYLHNSVEVRSRVLAGIIDTDGCTDGSKSRYEIIQKNKRLSDDIVQLAKSLGWYNTSREVEKSCIYKGEKRSGLYQRMYLRPGKLAVEIPVLLERKKLKQTTCGPKIDEKGHPIDKQCSLKWNDNLDNLLRDVVKNFMSGKRIMWKKIVDSTPIFRELKISPDGLRTRYREIKE